MLHVGNSKPVTGDIRHQGVLRHAAGPLGPLGPSSDRRHLVVRLERDPHDRRNPGAVKVALNGETVGHVPAARLDEYNPLLDWAAAVGYEVLCRAHLVGGHPDCDGTPAALGIYLNHSSPPVVQFHGYPPSLADPQPSWWGDWIDIDVVGEGHHQDFLARRQFRMNVAELVPGEQGRLHVEIETTRVGHLTSGMSERYRPGVVKRPAAEQPVTVFCKVKPGAQKLEVSVKLPRNEALAGWETGV